jgi:hypothetical protein
VTTDRRLAALVVGRLLVGGGALVAPKATGRVFGVNPAANPAAPFVGRLFGVRAVMMALLAAGTDGVDQERQLRAGVAVDLIDAAAALAAGRGRQLGTASAAAAFAAAMTEAALGVSLVMRPPRR